MSKYSFQEKYEAVLRVVNDGMSQRESARIMGVHRSIVGEWVNRYLQNGVQALLNGGASYNGEFKLLVVKYMHDNHLSYRSTANKFGVKCSTNVAKWERIYYEEGPDGLLKKKPRGRPPKEMTKKNNTMKNLSEERNEDLIAEVQRLRMENEYLKKLQALVQERIARENGNEPPSSMN